MSHILECLFLWNMFNKYTIILPIQNILFWSLFLKKNKATYIYWLSRKLYFYAGNSLRIDRFLRLSLNSLRKHLNVYQKQLMPSMWITSSSWTVMRCGDRQDLLLWLTSYFENEMQCELGNKLDKPITGWSCYSEVFFFLGWNHSYWESV